MWVEEGDMVYSWTVFLSDYEEIDIRESCDTVNNVAKLDTSPSHLYLAVF